MGPPFSSLGRARRSLLKGEGFGCLFQWQCVNQSGWNGTKGFSGGMLNHPSKFTIEQKKKKILLWVPNVRIVVTWDLCKDWKETIRCNPL